MGREEQAICEAISSWFEPKPDEVEHGPIYSEKGAWYRSPKLFKWQPLDYYHDESANARLLEAMPFPILAYYRGERNGVLVVDVPFWECAITSQGIHERSSDRKTAVVMAFCKFANIALEGRAE